MTWEGHTAVVVGLARSGRAAMRALTAAGARVVGLDRTDTEALRGAVEGLPGTVVLGVGDERMAGYLKDADLVVVSPGVPADSPVIVGASAQGLPVLSEPELAWRLAAGRTRLVVVSGTNGKTSTTELIGQCLDAPTAGNIGTPIVEVLGAHQPPPLVVAELSSFQLRFTDTLRAQTAVLLNVAPDHLDWHGSLEAYRAAKARAWERQGPGDWAVTNADDEGARACVTAYPPPAGHATFTLSRPGTGQVGIEDGRLVSRMMDEAVDLIAVEELQAKGPHNLANAAAAAAGALCAGAAAQRVAAALRAYLPGPHRLEAVAEQGGIAFINDSKATNPHAAAAGIASFPSVVWIAGGLNKGLSFDELAPLVKERVRAVVTIGTSGPEIAELCRSLGVETVEAGVLDRAVPLAAALAKPGDTVLLSPACASMDQFRDYAERGEAFRHAVAALLRAGGRHGD